MIKLFSFIVTFLLFSCFVYSENSNTNLANLKSKGLKVNLEKKRLTLNETWKGSLNDLKKIEQLHGFKELHFEKAPIQDSYIHFLKDLTWLQTLRIIKTSITDHALIYVHQMPHLKKLSLGNNLKVLGHGMKYVGLSKSIISLHIPHMHLDDNDLIHIKDMTQLRYLSLHSNEFTSFGIQYLKDFSKLETLYLKEVQPTPKDCEVIADLPSLKNLSMTFMNFTHEHLKVISQSKSIQALNIRDTKITQNDLPILKKFSSLQFIQLNGPNRMIQKEGLDYVKNKIPHLKVVYGKELQTIFEIRI